MYNSITPLPLHSHRSQGGEEMHFDHLANKDDGIPPYFPSKHLLPGVNLLVYLYSAVKVTIMLKIFIYLVNFHPLCRCWHMITPPFR